VRGICVLSNMLVPEACFRSCLQKHVSEAVLIVQKLFCASEAVLVQKLFCGSEAVISLYFKLKLFVSCLMTVT
jgi:hypothetical protein